MPICTFKVKQKNMCIFNYKEEEKMRSIIVNGKDAYKCGACGFLYREKEYAEKCETFCKEHNSCSLEITKHAIKKELGKNI